MRIEATVATLAPELKVIAPVRGWQMGREEEIAYAREHGIPIKGGSRDDPVLDRRQPLGPLVRGQVDRGPHARARRRRLPARHAARARARRAGDRRRSRSSRACPVALNGERAGSRRPARARRRDRLPARRRDHRPHRGPHRRPEGARHLRGPGGGDHPRRRTPSSSAWSARSIRTSSRATSTASGATSSTPGLWWEPLRENLDAYMDSVNERVTRHDRAEALQGLGPRRHAREPERRLRRLARDVRDQRRPLQPAGLARVHRAVVAAVAPGLPAQGLAARTRDPRPPGYRHATCPAHAPTRRSATPRTTAAASSAGARRPRRSARRSAGRKRHKTKLRGAVIAARRGRASRSPPRAAAPARPSDQSPPTPRRTRRRAR